MQSHCVAQVFAVYWFSCVYSVYWHMFLFLDTPSLLQPEDLTTTWIETSNRRCSWMDVFFSWDNLGFYMQHLGLEGYWMVINPEELYSMALGIFLRIVYRRISCCFCFVFFWSVFLLSIIVNYQSIIMRDYIMLLLLAEHVKQFLSIAWKLHLGSCPWKMVFAKKLLSYWKGNFSGAKKKTLGG